MKICRNNPTRSGEKTPLQRTTTKISAKSIWWQSPIRITTMFRSNCIKPSLPTSTRTTIRKSQDKLWRIGATMCTKLLKFVWLLGTRKSKTDKFGTYLRVHWVEARNCTFCLRRSWSSWNGPSITKIKKELLFSIRYWRSSSGKIFPNWAKKHSWLSFMLAGTQIAPKSTFSSKFWRLSDLSSRTCRFRKKLTFY